ncbi:MAG: hypothetical protein RIS44_2433 [Pseudomonadota bacterium]|jgi:NitT/TauT family transport system permease protein
MKTRTLHRWAPWITLSVALLLWQLVCSVFNVADYIFPSPWAIAQSMAEFMGPIPAAAWKTF